MEFFNGTGGDPLKPSLFELVAQEQLRDLLQPALKYVLSVFAQRYPRNLLRIVNRHEEFYALIMFFVERHYLRKYNASFAENFYGLKRRRRPLIETERAKAAVGGVPPEESLRTREVWRSLILLIGIPYIRAKAQDYFEDVGGGIGLEELEDGGRVAAAAAAQTVSSADQKRGILALIKRLLITSPRLLLDSLKLLLPTAIFFIKFLEWWYSPSSPARALSTSPLGPSIPPPSLLPPHPRGIPVDRTKYGQCPLCQNPIANATALPSGYVFCYRCVYDQVEKHGKCPVTFLPARVWQLRKVLV
ncbi:hypothetical protein EW146_g6377 [Bondarzewia mesenterica]|uniref:Peroxisome assembly protein 12 n=1 Tax=Bondarzewia mesenterica TaxID=1095465 RepID=A0A4S4LPC4_9AGAM|nr:hypothetical protein EW146_g6377 [Bondarzewia mesenterica]